jgi:hypothetical protein
MQSKDFVKALTKAKECGIVSVQSFDCIARKRGEDI